MITLPSKWQNYIDGSFETVIMIRIVTVDGTVLRWSTIDTNRYQLWTGDRYEEGRITKGGLGNLVYSANVDKGGCIAKVGEFKFVILNHDNYWNTLSGYNLTNALIVVKRFIMDVEPTEFDEGLTRFTGRINKVSFDREYIYINCDHDESEHRVLPKKIIDSETFPDFTIPDNSNGKPVPMLFGHMEKAEAFFCNNHTETLYGPAIATEGGQWIRDDNASWETDEFVDKDLEIIGGPGKGQIAAIKNNTDIRIYPYDYLQTPTVTDQSIYKVTDTQFDMVLADQKIYGYLDELNAVVSGQDGTTQACWFWDSSAKIYVRMNQSVLTWLNNSSPFSNLAGLRFLAGVVKENKITFFYPYVFTRLTNTSNWTNPNNAIDFNNMTAATSHFPENEQYLLAGWFETDLDDTLGSWDKLYLFLAGVHNNPGPGDAILNVQPHDYAGNLKTLGTGNIEKTVAASYAYNSLLKYISPKTSYPPWGLPDGSNIDMHDITPNFDQGDWATLNYNRYFLIGFHSNGVGAYDVGIYYMGLVFAKTLALNEQSRFFFNTKGRLFLSTWYGRKTINNLIEGPAEIIEEILRTDLGVANVADLDMSKFDYITATERSGWKMAFQVTKEINSLELFKNICEETGMIYYKTPEGKHSLRVIDPSVATSKVITTSDILTEDDDGNGSTFKVSFSPIENVYNEYFVHYDKDPATGDYHGLKYVKNPNLTFDVSYTNLSSQGDAYHALCAASYVKYGQVMPKHFYLDYIHDESTAEKYLKKMCVYCYLQRAEPEFKSQLQLIALELGDEVQMGTELLDGNYFIYSIEEDLTKDIMTFKLRNY
jgi:hypothetical protein